jgi:hypothetical protein
MDIIQYEYAFFLSTQPSAIELGDQVVKKLNEIFALPCFHMPPQHPAATRSHHWEGKPSWSNASKGGGHKRMGTYHGRTPSQPMMRNKPKIGVGSDGTKKLIGLLNKLSPTNKDKIEPQILELATSPSSPVALAVDDICKAILTHCTKQGNYLSILLDILDGLYRKSNRPSSMLDTMEAFCEDFFNKVNTFSSSMFLDVNVESEYDEFCEQVKHKSMILCYWKTVIALCSRYSLSHATILEDRFHASFKQYVDGDSIDPNFLDMLVEEYTFLVRNYKLSNVQQHLDVHRLCLKKIEAIPQFPKRVLFKLEDLKDDLSK